MKDFVTRNLSGWRTVLGVTALATAVVAAACSGSTPGAPSLASDIASTALEAPSVGGNCSIPGAEKDESSPFFIEGGTEVWIKAGNTCVGPITTSGVYNSCFDVTFDASGVTVLGLGGRACRGLGVSHIEANVTKEPPCEIDPKTGQCKVEEPPK